MRIQRVSYRVKGFVNLADYALRLAHMVNKKGKSEDSCLLRKARHQSNAQCFSSQKISALFVEEETQRRESFECCGYRVFAVQ